MRVAMLPDWFRSLELPIPFSEFARLPRHPAYKYEYFDNRAVLTPRPCYRRATLDLSAFASANSMLSECGAPDPRSLKVGDWDLLPELLAAAFQRVPPFATLSDDLRLNAADDCVRRTRAGADGAVLDPACFVAMDRGKPTRLDGAIVITVIRDRDSGGAGRPHLTWVLVHPWRFGRGLGTAMLASAATVLRGLGYRELASTFLVGNERSALWHWRNGFRLESPLSRGERGTGGEDRNGEGVRG
jgi:GNAT superfamily N-acetyltransferase